jgi:hypothetical protein
LEKNIDSLKLNNDLANTAFIPLWARANAGKFIYENHEEWELSKELLTYITSNTLPLDYMDKITKSSTILDIGLRSILINDIIHVDKSNQIINLGCGFDIKNKLFNKRFDEWINIDVKEIIEIRDKFLNEKNNIIGSLENFFDLNIDNNLKTTLILEGVAMYFDQITIRTFIQKFFKKFKASKMIIEVGGKWIKSFQHPAFSKMGLDSKYKWGINNEKEFSVLFPGHNVKFYQKVLLYRKDIWDRFSVLFNKIPIIASKLGSHIIVLENLSHISLR